MLKTVDTAKNVWLLTVCQALSMSIPSFVVFVGSIIGAHLAPDPAYATVPVAVFMLGSAGAMLPVVLAMRSFGRKSVFITCMLLACGGCVLGMVALQYANFPLYLLSLVVLGIGLAAGQQYRFAAMESVDTTRMASAASRVLMGGIVAAFLGPELAARGQAWFAVPFQGSFVLLLIVTALTAALLLRFQEPATVAAERVGGGRPLRVLFKQPVLWAAMGAGIVGFAVMSLIMTATPLHMHVVNGHALEDTKWVIQSHVAAMFIPSFIAPWLIRHLGTRGLIATGILAYLAVVAVVFTPAGFADYWIGLVLLGVGWNFLFIGGTTLLPESYGPTEKFRVQAANDVTIFGIQAIGAMSAGWLVVQFGWQAMLFVTLPMLALLALAVLIWWRSQSRALRVALTQSEP